MVDYRGVGEALNEQQNGKGLTVRMRHYITFDGSYRRIQMALDTAPITTISSINHMPISKNVSYKSENLLKHVQLPDMTKIYMRYLGSKDGKREFLTRFHNMDDNNLKIINNVQGVEMTLSNNQLKEDMMKKKMDWPTKQSIQKIKRDIRKILRVSRLADSQSQEI